MQFSCKRKYYPQLLGLVKKPGYINQIMWQLGAHFQDVQTNQKGIFILDQMCLAAWLPAAAR
jgi:hypothetical protein